MHINKIASCRRVSGRDGWRTPLRTRSPERTPVALYIYMYMYIYIYIYVYGNIYIYVYIYIYICIYKYICMYMYMYMYKGGVDAWHNLGVMYASGVGLEASQVRSAVRRPPKGPFAHAPLWFSVSQMYPERPRYGRDWSGQSCPQRPLRYLSRVRSWSR